jgi:hypothetical protein
MQKKKEKRESIGMEFLLTFFVLYKDINDVLIRFERRKKPEGKSKRFLMTYVVFLNIHVAKNRMIVVV